MHCISTLRFAKCLFLICSVCLFILSHPPAYCTQWKVSTIQDLNNALNQAEQSDVITLQDGTYHIENQFALTFSQDGITLQSESNDPRKVIIQGQGMQGSVNHGFWVNRNNITIQGVTIQDVANHCIQLDVNTDNFHLKNCILRDAYEQLFKVPYSQAVSDPSENGIIEDCRFEYSAGVAPNWYTGGIDVHFGKNWIVRDSVFKDIQSPEEAIAEHAIHFWTKSQGTRVHRNMIINCDRGIGFGLGSSPHFGGIICNNMISHDGSGIYADVGIGIESSNGTQIFNNTIFLDHSRYANAIEYRFSQTQNVHIANNLTNKRITARDGGSALLEANITQALSSWFVQKWPGDLHLTRNIPEVVDQGVSIPGLNQDFDRDPRPLDIGIDIGADEYRPIFLPPCVRMLLL